MTIKGVTVMPEMTELTVVQIVLVALQLLSCLFIISVIILQSGKRSGLSGAIAGVADSFMSKTKARSFDARLARITKWVAVLFVLLTLTLGIILRGA
jgi:preprotein translocase subunit SecG